MSDDDQSSKRTAIPASPKGVLGSHYADNRVVKKELNFRYRVRGEAIAYAVRRHLPSAEPGTLALLDMGAADGKTLQYMDECLSLAQGLGIEYNPDLIGKAGPLAPHLRLLQGDVTQLAEAEDGHFDVVSALAILEHLKNPRLAVSEAARVLKKGGLFVASSPVPFWDHCSVRLGLLAEDHHECDMHASFFRALFTEVSGMKLVEFRKFMWAPIGFMPYLGIVPDPRKALEWDRRIERIKVFNFLFINQLAVAVKE